MSPPPKNMTGLNFWAWTVIDSIVLIFHIAYLYVEAFLKLIFPKRYKSLEGEIILVSDLNCLFFQYFFAFRKS